MEVVEREMAEHREDGVRVVLVVPGRPRPVVGAKAPKPGDETRAVVLETAQRLGEIELQQGVLGIVPARVVRRDHRIRLREHQIQPAEEERMDLGQVAGIFVNGPLARRRAALEDVRVRLAHQGNDDGGSPLERRHQFVRRRHSMPSYSMTWAARSSSDCGMERWSALAVLRLITSSNLAGCSTGRSAGLAPFRILSTKYAARRPTSSKLAPYDMRPPAST